MQQEMNQPMRAEGYEDLAYVLEQAFEQAARGKGKDRHANDLPFNEQPIMTLQEMFGPGFALGQAAKKAQEAQRMGTDAAVRELLGAINYIAGAIIHIQSQDQEEDLEPEENCLGESSFKYNGERLRGKIYFSKFPNSKEKQTPFEKFREIMINHIAEHYKMSPDEIEAMFFKYKDGSEETCGI